MQTLKAYLYPIVLEVQIPDPTIFKVRKRTVYAHPIKVYQGIDNPIQILVRNQDNKPIDLTGYTMQVNLQDSDEEVTVFTYIVNYIDIEQGSGQIIIPAEDLAQLDQRRYKLAVKRINDTDDSQTPAYSDANYGMLLDLEVLPGFY